MNPPVDLSWIGAEDFRFPDWVALRQAILREPLGLSYSEADLEAEAGEKHLLAEQSGHLLGGLAVRVLAPRRWKIRQVAVKESEQGKGWGRILMREAMSAAQAAGVTEVVLHSRARVVPFYEKLGFVIIGEPFEEVGLPHHKMEITLPFESPA